MIEDIARFTRRFARLIIEVFFAVFLRFVATVLRRLVLRLLFAVDDFLTDFLRLAM